MTTGTGKLSLEIPQGRQASVDPQLIAKYQRRFPGFDETIISMHARGMSTSETARHLARALRYRRLAGPDQRGDGRRARGDRHPGRARPLEAVYPIVFLNALGVKIRDEGLVRNKAVPVALGARANGTREILGLWLSRHEGAKFWLRVMTETNN